MHRKQFGAFSRTAARTRLRANNKSDLGEFEHMIRHQLSIAHTCDCTFCTKKKESEAEAEKAAEVKRTLPKHALACTIVIAQALDLWIPLPSFLFGRCVLALAALFAEGRLGCKHVHVRTLTQTHTRVQEAEAAAAAAKKKK